MKKPYSFSLFFAALLSGTALVSHAQIAPSSAGQMTSHSTMDEPDEDFTVTAPSDAPAPTANDGNVTNDATPPATVDNGEPLKRTDGTVDSSEVEKPNPEIDITEGSPNYGNSLASGTVQADLSTQEEDDLLNQQSRSVTVLQDGTVIGQPNVVAPATSPVPNISVPATGGAMGGAGVGAGATTSASGGAMGNTSGGSAGASSSGGAFGK